MQIFNDEKSIEDKIVSSLKVQADTLLIDRPDITLIAGTKTANKSSLIDALQPNTIDLDSFWFPAILVTTNWNRNDDVFTPTETFAARNTALYKPVGWLHNTTEQNNETIGVINSNVVIDDNYNIINDILPKFHIAVGILIWKKYFPSYGEEIENGIAKKELFVSMEALFSNFGYAIKKPGSEDIHLIDRDDESAWMTQFLRVYGGPGKIKVKDKEYRIGRWLRNITFSGVGCVHNPANPESIILSDIVHAETKILGITDQELKELKESKISNFDQSLENSVLILEPKGETMSDQKVEKVVACGSEAADMEKMKADLASLQASLAEVTKAKDTAEASLASLKAESEALAAKNKDMEDAYAKLQTEASDQAKAKKDVEASLATAQETLTNIEKDKVAATRLDELKKVNAVEDEAKTLASVREMNAETFASVLSFAQAAFKKTTETAVTSMAKSTDQKVTTNTATTEVAKAEVENKEPSLVTANSALNTDTKVEALKAFGKKLVGKTK